MKHILTICMVILFLTSVKAQNIYYDAKKVIRLKQDLARGGDTLKADTLLAILHKAAKQKLTSKDGNTKEITKLGEIDNIFRGSEWGAIHNLISLVASKKSIEITDVIKYINSTKKVNPDTSAENTLNKIKEIFENNDTLSAMITLINTSGNGQDTTIKKSIENNDITIAALKIIKDPDTTRKWIYPDVEVFKEKIKELNVKALNLFRTNMVLMIAQNSSLKKINDAPIKEQVLIVETALANTQASARFIFEQEVASKMNIPSQSDVIDAMAIYLANRVKLETALTFMDLIKKAMKNDSLLLELFPLTEKTLTAYSTYEAPNFGSAWRSAFSEDFLTLPEKLGNENMSSYLKQRFGVPVDDGQLVFLQQAVNFAVTSRSNTNFLDVIEYLKNQYNEKQINTTFSDFIRVVNLINNEFYATNKKNFWISYVEFNNMDIEEWEIMLTLLRSKYPFLEKYYSSADQKRVAPTIAEIKTWFSKLLYVINQYQSSAIQTSPQRSTHVISNYWRTTKDLLLATLSTANGRVVFQQINSADNANLIKIITHLSNLYTNIDEKNYPLAFNEVTGLVTTLQTSNYINNKHFNSFFIKGNKAKYPKQIEKIQNSTLEILNLVAEIDNTKSDSLKKVILQAKLVIKRDTLDTLLSKYGGKDLVKSFVVDKTKFLDTFLRKQDFYTNLYNENSTKEFNKVIQFINDVAKTTDSKELSKVIASHASPPLSYRLKRYKKASWDVNAYVGIVGGYEGLKDRSKGQFAYGLSAPIGISYSLASKTNKPTPNAYKKDDGTIGYFKGNAWTFSLSIIDIGAVVRYRFGNGNEEGLPAKVSFAQVLSPGIHIRRGIKNTPLCYFVGAQYIPQLRNFDGDNESIRDYSGVYQINLGVAFDLPLFNLTSTKTL